MLIKHANIYLSTTIANYSLVKRSIVFSFLTMNNCLNLLLYKWYRISYRFTTAFCVDLFHIYIWYCFHTGDVLIAGVGGEACWQFFLQELVQPLQQRQSLLL